MRTVRRFLRFRPSSLEHSNGSVHRKSAARQHGRGDEPPAGTWDTRKSCRRSARIAVAPAAHFRLQFAVTAEFSRIDSEIVGWNSWQRVG